MSPERFISERLRFKGNLAVIATAVSFMVIIVSFSISSGFREEIRSSLSALYGDITVESPSLLPVLDSTDGITSVRPFVLKEGIVKSGLHIQGVSFKGCECSDSLPLQVEIPAGFARKMNLSAGDMMTAYFVGEKVQARNFTVKGIYDDLWGDEKAVTVRASAKDLRRLTGLAEDEYSGLELTLDNSLRDRAGQKWKAREISYLSGCRASSLADRFPQIFDWLDLIDMNVKAILLIMVLVAGFNMISGLLIYLFRNTSTIGVLKALGMTDRSIRGVFLRVAARVVAEGMLAGNALALLFCVIQDRTHMLKLNPDNYFLSFVPVDVSPVNLICIDAIAFAAIIVMITLPLMFIYKVDPARTVRSL